MENTSSLFALLKKLMTTGGVSGREHEIRDTIKALVMPYADEISEDPMGNLIVRKRGNGKRLMFCAHMDEIGFFVTHITGEGFIRVSRVGGINTIASAYTEVVSEKGVCGILVPESSKDKPDIEEMYIDIGAKTKKDAERRVSVGDFFVCKPSIRKLMGQRYVGRPFDDRVGCAIMIQALKELKSTDNDIYMVFSVQEEVGGRGAGPAAFTVAPDYGICIDVTTTNDKPGASGVTAAMGKGCAIKLMDSSVISSPELVKQVKEIAKGREDIKWQDEILLSGGTDTPHMQMAGKGAQVMGISIPTANIHSGVEMIDMNDVTNAIKMVVLICENLK